MECSLLLLLAVGVGLLATEVAGHEPESCDTATLALHINGIPYPVTEKDRGAASCEVVRSGVDSSLAAAAGVPRASASSMTSRLFSSPASPSRTSRPRSTAPAEAGTSKKPGSSRRNATEYWLDCHPGGRRRRTRTAPWRTRPSAATVMGWLALCQLSSRKELVEARLVVLALVAWAACS
ncbi:uncharacterized protein [Triticum aestivum]|uniref:uncharacterized protein n=1 Tax=Triticum aestivum TaxID=4565 RepID=UPI001D0067F3|nr:uncharacterized protein LOC123116782 [Triticum aestivum]